MTDSNASAPRLLIATRFGLGIKDLSWFRHRLELLAAITVPSLKHQDDQSFEWALFVDHNLSSEIRVLLEQLIAPFQGRAFLCTLHHSSASMLQLAVSRGLVDTHGYLLAGRIDDDDAWATHTVSQVRERVRSWRARAKRTAGYGFTFEDGLVWIMYDMLDIDQHQKRGVKIERAASIRPYRYPFTSISGFTYTPIEGGVTCVSGGHAAVPRFMAKHGYTVEHIRSEEAMWLYCRHKQTDSPIYRNQQPAVQKTLTELSQQFGIDRRHTAAYISSADKHGYTKALRKFIGRRDVMVELRELALKMKSLDLEAVERSELLARKCELETELELLKTDVVENPADLQRPTKR